MDNSHYSPSELIDLALDCELDSTQATSLFTLLASDGALQEEFRQAIAIRRALNNDVLAGIPSMAFTQSLFQQAGVEMPGDSTPPFVKSGSKWVSLATTAIVFLGIGIVTTIGINKLYSDRQVENHNPINLPKLYSMEMPSEIGSTSYINNQLNKYTENPLSPFHTPTYRHNQKSSKGTTDGITMMPENNTAELSVGLSSEEITAVEPLNKLKTVASPVVKSNQVFAQNIRVDYTSIFEENLNTVEYSDRKLSLQLRGIMGIKFFNNQVSVIPPSPLMNNLGITLKYDLSDNHAVGFEVGQESFPGMIETSDGRLQPTASIAWTGVSYQYTLPTIKLLGSIRPFIQTVAGGTGFGPIAKGIIGLRMPIKNRMSIFTAAEGTVMGYRYHSNWYSAQKISFSTGLMLNF